MTQALLLQQIRQHFGDRLPLPPSMKRLLVTVASTYRELELRQEQCVQSSELRPSLSSVFQSIAGGVLVRDTTDVIIERNPAAERLLALNFEQMRGEAPLPTGWGLVRDDGRDCPKYGGGIPANAARRSRARRRPAWSYRPGNRAQVVIVQLGALARRNGPGDRGGLGVFRRHQYSPRSAVHNVRGGADRPIDILTRTLLNRGVEGVLPLPMAAPWNNTDLLEWSRFSVVATNYSVRAPDFDRAVGDVGEGVQGTFARLKAPGYRRIGAVTNAAFDEFVNNHVSAALATRAAHSPAAAVASFVYRAPPISAHACAPPMTPEINRPAPIDPEGGSAVFGAALNRWFAEGAPMRCSSTARAPRNSCCASWA